MPKTTLWTLWRDGFYAWEKHTAQLLEQMLQSPLMMEPAGALLTATMKSKKQWDDAIARTWSAAGFPTRREQEQILHTLNQLQSRLIDLELDQAEQRDAEGQRG